MNELYSVVAFAYNEERRIKATLTSILDNCDSRLACVTVVANGCTDRTVDVAEKTLAESHFPYEIVELKLGDKCNAWNHYIYHNLPEVSVNFFVDSDVTFTSRAFPVLFEKLKASPEKNAVTGLPQTGRNIEQYTELATRYSCLFGNLYGLRHEFINRLVANNIRLPIGLSWIDAQLTKLVNDNLEYYKNDYQPRVTFVRGIGYHFDSLKPWRLADIKLYINRICGYKAGQMQEPYLDALPFVEWPATMDPINRRILDRGVHWNDLGKIAPFRSKVIKKLSKCQHPQGLPNRWHQ